MHYRKIPKISPPGLYFSKALLEGLLYGGKFAFQNRLGYLIAGRNLPFLLCLNLYFRAISKYKPPPGRLYLEGQCSGGFSMLRVCGAYIWRG